MAQELLAFHLSLVYSSVPEASGHSLSPVGNRQSKPVCVSRSHSGKQRHLAPSLMINLLILLQKTKGTPVPPLLYLAKAKRNQQPPCVVACPKASAAGETQWSFYTWFHKYVQHPVNTQKAELINNTSHLAKLNKNLLWASQSKTLHCSLKLLPLRKERVMGVVACRATIHLMLPCWQPALQQGAGDRLSPGRHTTSLLAAEQGIPSERVCGELWSHCRAGYTLGCLSPQNTGNWDRTWAWTEALAQCREKPAAHEISERSM